VSAAADTRGPLAWMAHNRVTPNLVMLFLLVGGAFMSTRIKKEVFPDFELDTISVTIAYPGASPEEVEQGIVLAVEEAVRGLDGVKEVSAVAAEGVGRITVELLESANGQNVYQEVQQEVERITTFPEEAEQPQVTLDVRRRGVIEMQLYGQADAWTLRSLAEDVRDRLLQEPGITQVDLEGVRNFEIHVEIPEDNLRAYGLTLAQVAEAIRATAVELPGGSLKTDGGEILVRFKERRDWAEEFARLPLITTAAGALIRLEDVARVAEGFEDRNVETTYDGMPSVEIAVCRIGAQTPIGVSDAVRSAMRAIEPDLPPGIRYAINNDWSDIYRQRLGLLLRNAFLGLLLVLLVLGLFLEFKLAFWVTLGIPVSFLGGLLFMPILGVSINMISMFAFIIALGIVVDDAIIAGENIYEYRQRGMPFLDAAIRGARDVSVPIAFSILTNVVAFLPLYFVPGFIGKIWRVIPLVVISVFLISWLESLLILPSHLGHTRSRPGSPLAAALHRRQQAVSRLLTRFIERVYGPFLARCLRWRFLTVSLAITVLLVVLAYVRAGHIGIILMPRVEADSASVTAVVPFGSPTADACAVRDRLERDARAVAAANGGERLLKGIVARIDENEIDIRAYLQDANVRPITTSAFTAQWRRRVGDVPGLESLQFAADRGGPGSGAALTVELSHRRIDVLDSAGAALAAQLAEFPNVKDIDDGFTPGKRQLDFALTPAGRSLGLTSAAVARQVRHAFYGAEALRQQRGRNEVKVLARLPARERTRAVTLERLLIRTPEGRDVPLADIARVLQGRSYTAITRREGRRTITVKADVDPIDQTARVQNTLDRTLLPQLARDYPGLSYGYEGRQADFAESMSSLIAGLLLALLAIYFLLAIPFRSYVQPLIVMTSIPFGIVGAVLGHVVMGYSLSIISVMGIIALAGVVVNDSLVLIEYANRLRAEGMNAHDAIHAAGVRRFRPVLLTTLTTFGGLAPMIFETSRQARFMIPMALSLGYGILFATGIALILVPCLYVIIDTVSGRRSGAASRGARVSASETAAP
jgi:multidrug efflux pump subunit AcrB